MEALKSNRYPFFSASIQKLFATTSLAKDNDGGIHGKSLSEEMKEEIAAIKQVIQEQVLKRLDGLSTKADRCRGGLGELNLLLIGCI